MPFLVFRPTVMLDPALLRGQLTSVAERLATRSNYTLDVSALESLESDRKAVQVETQELQNLRNTRSKAIGVAKGKGESTDTLMAEVASIADQLKANETRLADIQQQLSDIALGMPNLPDVTVPIGRDETDNVEQHSGHAARCAGRLARCGNRREDFGRTFHLAAWRTRSSAPCTGPIHARPSCR